MRAFIVILCLLFCSTASGEFKSSEISIVGYDKYSPRGLSGDLSVSGDAQYWIALEASGKTDGEVYSILYYTKNGTVKKIERPEKEIKTRSKKRSDPLRVWAINDEASNAVGDDKSTGQSFIFIVADNTTTLFNSHDDYRVIHSRGINDSEEIVGYVNGPDVSGDPGNQAFYKKTPTSKPILYQFRDAERTRFDSVNNEHIAMGRSWSENGWILFSYNVDLGEFVEILYNPNDEVPIPKTRGARSATVTPPPLYDGNDKGYDNDKGASVGYTTWNNDAQEYQGVVWDPSESTVETVRLGENTTITSVNEERALLGMYTNRSGQPAMFIAQKEKEVIPIETFSFFRGYFRGCSNDKLSVNMRLFSEEIPLSFVHGQNVDFEITIKVNGVEMQGIVSTTANCKRTNFCNFYR